MNLVTVIFRLHVYIDDPLNDIGKPIDDIVQSIRGEQRRVKFKNNSCIDV